TKQYGFVGVVVSVEDLSASIWGWHRDGSEWAATKEITIPDEPAARVPPLALSAALGCRPRDGSEWAATKVITIPANRAAPALLPPVIQPFGAVPPLVTDIDLSVDDQWLYVSCWGTGELKRYDVSDPFHPKEAGSVRIGGIVGK